MLIIISRTYFLRCINNCFTQTDKLPTFLNGLQFCFVRPNYNKSANISSGRNKYSTDVLL